MAKTKLERFCDVLGVDAEQFVEKSKTRKKGNIPFALLVYCKMSPADPKDLAKTLNITLSYVNICKAKKSDKYLFFEQTEKFEQCKAILESKDSVMRKSGWYKVILNGNWVCAFNLGYKIKPWVFEKRCFNDCDLDRIAEEVLFPIK